MVQKRLFCYSSFLSFVKLTKKYPAEFNRLHNPKVVFGASRSAAQGSNLITTNLKGTALSTETGMSYGTRV